MRDSGNCTNVSSSNSVPVLVLVLVLPVVIIVIIIIIIIVKFIYGRNLRGAGGSSVKD